MEMLTGEYCNTLDDKGRILFPSKLRSELENDALEKGLSENNVLMVTQGLDHCLMLFTMDEWASLSKKIMESSSIFNDQKTLVIRRFIAPAQRLEFDRSGRLSIPQKLREYAGLKGECTILGMIKYMELWDSETYSQYLEKTEDQYKDAALSMSEISL